MSLVLQGYSNDLLFWWSLLAFYPNTFFWRCEINRTATYLAVGSCRPQTTKKLSMIVFIADEPYGVRLCLKRFVIATATAFFFSRDEHTK